MTHTPGPLPVAVVYDAYHGRQPISVTFGDSASSRNNAEALARVIAQAFAMLALLGRFADHDTDARHYDLTGLCTDARALLRVVEGG